jgi:hypothetical protein
MSLNVSLNKEFYTSNITHNLTRMADAAGIYMHLWRPEEINIHFAWELIKPLTEGLAMLESYPEKFKEFNSPNGWGMYDHFVVFVREYLFACIANQSATVSVSR